MLLKSVNLIRDNGMAWHGIGCDVMGWDDHVT
jgi:hypothetical protein